MEKKVWVFSGLENGQFMECNDIEFLLHQVMVFRGIKVPAKALLALRFERKASWKGKSPNGGACDFSIVEVTK